MSRKYFTVEKDIDRSLKLVGEEAHHISNVMRKKIGDELIFFNGDGFDYFCKIDDITKNEVILTVNDKYLSNTNTNFELLVCVGLMKGDKNEFVIQKCSELGASKLLFFESEFCVAKEKQSKMDRYNKISIEASKQSGRASIMEILPTVKFNNLKNILKDYDKIFCAYENGGISLSKCDFKNDKIAIIIGSEGGFSTKEIEYLKNSLDNVEIITLGNRILRAETAVLALTTIVMHNKGEI